MQAYGAVAPSATLRSTDERSSKSNGKSFMAIIAGVVVLGASVDLLTVAVVLLQTAAVSCVLPRWGLQQQMYRHVAAAGQEYRVKILVLCFLPVYSCWKLVSCWYLEPARQYSAEPCAVEGKPAWMLYSSTLFRIWHEKAAGLNSAVTIDAVRTFSDVLPHLALTVPG